jgi:hypothetical protein
VNLFLGQFGPDAWTDRNSRAYRIHMPHDLTVVAACEDVGCDQWRSGWVTECDESAKPGAMVAAWIRSGQCGRTFREAAGTQDGRPVAIFYFDSGQRCFQEHRTRPGRLLVYSGGRGAREHVSLSDLAEDYTEHMGGIAAQQERG